MMLQIMVIGIACTLSDWTPRLLHALAADREVIIYDSAGIGQSTIEAGWSIDPADYFKFQGDTLAGLITALQLDELPDVLGWYARNLPPHSLRPQVRPVHTAENSSLLGWNTTHPSVADLAGMHGKVHDCTSKHPCLEVS
jgi:hypothetical protein